MYQVVKNYRENRELRHSLNRLTEKTFGFSFEDWYENGFWRDNYIPYSIVKDGEVIANVSVNIMDMKLKGEIRHYIQLGTVMTEEAYRNQGLIRQLMQEIDKDYASKVDGIYLFAGADVCEFYPKFGFEKAKEYQCFRSLSSQATNHMEQDNQETSQNPVMVSVAMDNKEAWASFEQLIKDSQYQGWFDMANNSDLIMFYVTKFMQETVYYSKELEAYVIAEMEDEELFIHGVFSKNQVSINSVIQAFSGEYKKVVLGFTPEAEEGIEKEELVLEDTNLFVKGEGWEGFDQEMVMFPTLSHA